VLHLGSQVHGLGYDHERIFVSNVQRQLETRISAEQYRSTFNIPRVRYVYANSSNLAICGRLDRDLGRECYNRYQSSSLLLQLQSTNELYHKHVYGPIGIFCLHESGYRRWAGETRDASMHVYVWVMLLYLPFISLSFSLSLSLTHTHIHTQVLKRTTRESQ
jgi:hypothetical protein